VKIYYYRDPLGNFGDDLNPWMWPRLLPNSFDGNAAELFIGIGTLLSTELPTAPKKIIMGAGTGYGSPAELDGTFDVRFVRGPVTAEILGLSPQQWITDPAALLYRIPNPGVSKPRPAFIPHHRSTRCMDWGKVCGLAGIKYIDPRARPTKVLRQIQGCSLLLAEAMHGAILADAQRIPWIPVSIYPQFNHLKWKDWFRSLALREDVLSLTAQYDGAHQRFSARLETGIRWAIRNRSPRISLRLAKDHREERSPHAQERMAEALTAVLGEEPRLSDTLVLERAVHRMEEELFRFGGTLHTLA